MSTGQYPPPPNGWQPPQQPGQYPLPYNQPQQPFSQPLPPPQPYQQPTPPAENQLLFNATCKKGRLQIDNYTVRVVDIFKKVVWSVPRQAVTGIEQKKGMVMAEATIHTQQGPYVVQTLTKDEADRLVALLSTPVAYTPPAQQWQPVQQTNFGQPPYQPGQYQPPPYPQPPKRSYPWQWYKSKGRFAKFGLGCGSLLIVLTLCVFSLAAYGSTLPPQKTVQPTPTTNNTINQIATTGTTPTPLPASPTATPTQAPTDTPAPTPTSMPASIPASMAVMGGTIVAFDNKIGASNCCTDNGWDDGNNWVGVYTAEDGGRWYQAVGEQSNERVVGIYLHPYNTTSNGGTPVWNSAQAQKVCFAYLPSDTKFIKTVNGRNEYYSSLLAYTLPSGDFTDANNHTNKPGIFYGIFHNIDGFSTNVDYCAFGTDYSLNREDVTIL